MFINKKKYFLIIESIRDIDLSNLKLFNKFVIIYRNHNKIDNLNKLLDFRKKCKIKKIDFYVANNPGLMVLLKADGLYISSYSQSLKFLKFKKNQFKIIGSAHNIKEINLKNKQGCKYILTSRLFKTDYKNKIGYLGSVKFNLLNLMRNEDLVPLGGIKMFNLNKLNYVNSNSIALLSEIKKKPAKIFSRLF